MKKLIALVLAAALAGCSHPSQTVYGEQDIGRPETLEYGTIVAMRPIKIQPEDTSKGTLAGTLAGGAAGSAIGNDVGNTVATIGGALAGAAIGALAEQEISRRDGVEYTITEHGGKTVVIAQNIGKDDAPLKVGQHVVIQTDEKAKYRRVLSADGLPNRVKRPEAIKIVD